MNNLLRIDTSTRKIDSHSRDLANRLEKKWKEKNTDAQVSYRDLSKTEIPHLTQDFIKTIYVPSNDRGATENATLALSDELIAELRNADTILLSTPMFNFSVPSVLKAYIDQVSRVGETFSMDESGYTGLLIGKKLIIAAAYGADFKDMREMDFVEPYLKSLFSFLGFSDIEYFAIEGTSMLSEETIEASKAKLVKLFQS